MNEVLGCRTDHLEQRLSLEEKGKGVTRLLSSTGGKGESASLLQFHVITFVGVTQHRDLEKPHQKGETDRREWNWGNGAQQRTSSADTAGGKGAPAEGNPDGHQGS